jgi:DNA-binding NarL/FixJ family response regulator
VTVVRDRRPDVVLMDIRMPNLDGLEATRRILQREPACRVLMLTTFDLDRYVYAALAAGASGFLLKDVSPEHLVAAVRLVGTGDALLAPSITRRLVEKFAVPRPTVVHRELDVLTPREREVLARLVRGESTTGMARSMGVRLSTTRTHVDSVLIKLGVHSRLEAVAYAVREGIVDLPGGRQLDGAPDALSG